MKEKELDIDWKKHVCYSKAVKKIIREELRKKSKNNDEMEYMWEKVQQKYVEYLKEQSYLGGKKSGHNAAGGTYDCIAILAYYEVMDRKPSIEEIYQMNKELLLPSFAALGKIFNVNHPSQLRLLNKIFEQTAKRDKKMEKDLPEGYRMRTEPYQKDTGVHYRFERCPIAEFAKKHDLLEIMPAICNGDYPAFALLHAGLIRTSTCANGDVCDYWIVGDKSQYLKEHPEKVDEQGYIYNE